MEQALRDLLVSISNSPIGDPVDVLRIVRVVGPS